MTHDGRPLLATWADVDPARYPFDPGVVRAMALPAPGADALVWVDAVGVVLAERFGPWAYSWYWTPGESERLGWITSRVPAPAEVPAFVAGTLLVWRRWLENLAERFDQARAGGLADVAAWEVAVVHILRTVVAQVVDDDGWQGWSRRVLQWFLTAEAVPVAQAEALANDAVDERFDHWVTPTAAVLGEVAERLAGALPALPHTRIGDWPDTWPQDFPSWRATNT